MRDVNLGGFVRRGFVCGTLTKQKVDKMIRTSEKLGASAVALLASAFLVMTAPTARADDYCITNGAQAAHGCGYPTMEAC
ncbi:MAG TPA: DUF3551 domain-containing protein, partial [Bradyrhizobium sp.]|nr:DUF3551 domain-containing protein [Bradyrhizobium sp.]